MKLQWKRITAHTQHPFRIARPGSSVANDTRIERTVVSIEHAGIVGYGEAAPTPYYGQTLDTVEASMAQMTELIGDDPADIAAIIPRLVERFDDQRAAVAAVDAALHDWWGKREEKPVYELLGLKPVSPPTSMTIGIATHEEMTERVKEAADFKVLKIKVGKSDDAETLRLLRGLEPDKFIRVDANCGWSAEELPVRLEAMRPFNLELIEQPIPAHQLDAIRNARDAAPAPLVADEDSVRPEDVEVLAGAYHGINVKLSKCGGIFEAHRMLKRARELGLKTMLGCMVETSLGVSAAVHLASLADFVDLDGHLLLADDPFTGLRLEDGAVLPGSAPGLGVQPRSGLSL